jgi:hypothetical protein
MSVVYFHQPEELAPGLKTPIDDDSTNWWAGAQRCFAAAAAAAVLAGSTFAATLDRNLQRQTDDMVPQPVSQAVDEDYWQNPARPVPAANYQPLPLEFDAGELAPGAVSTAFDDEVFTPPCATTSFAACASTSSTALVPGRDDDAPQFTAPSFTPDEDYAETRQCRVSALVSWKALAQQDEGTQGIVTLFEEDAPPRAVIWLTRDCRDATMPRLYPGDPADLSRSSGPGIILARGIASAAPAHGLATSAAIAHTAAESSAAAHTCAASSVPAHSLSPGAKPAHTLTAEVMI